MRYHGSAPQIQAKAIEILAALPDSVSVQTYVTGARRDEAIPPHPATIGVVTSDGGAALRDVIHVIEQRAPWIRLVVAPASVQGDGAAASMARAILSLHTCTPQPDVILLCRGGTTDPGDLGPFSDPVLLTAMSVSTIPIATGIGHAWDETPADRVARLSCSTPTMCAVAVTPDRATLRSRLASLRERIDVWLRSQTAVTLPSAVNAMAAVMPSIVGSGGASPARLLRTAFDHLEEIARGLESPDLRHADAASALYPYLSSLSLAHQILETRDCSITYLPKRNV
jgi:exonuclease VII large subunit